MEWLTDPTVWVGFATLVVLEIVLGIDNLIFIAILADRLPAAQRDRARVIGLSLALIMRLALLASISWVMSLTAPVFTILGAAISWRDLILIAGGLFLLVKATTEIHDRVEAQGAGHAHGAAAAAAFWPVVAQIVVLDAVFSLDSVITAVGMVDELAVMMAAVVVAVALMLVASKPLTRFVSGHPSLVILCLGFLLMVGLMLVVDGFGVHVPKGYLYAAIGFSVLIEVLNQLAAKNRAKWAAHLPPRQRAAHAILRLLGGVPPEGDLAFQEPTGRTSMFDPAERRMMRGVLQLAQRPVTAIMTPRPDVAWLDAGAGKDEILEQVRSSPYREFPVGRGSVDEIEGLARKEDILAQCLEGKAPDLRAAVREALAIPASATVLSALEHFKRTPAEAAVVIDEYGGFQGLVTRTDLLEAIAGELPESAADQPGIRPVAAGRYEIDGSVALPDLQERLRIAALPEGDYATAAGLVLALSGSMPTRGDAVEWEGWRFEVAALDGMRIERLLAKRLPERR
jgi:CBS domain containing-hemolysin-like protein